MSRGSARGILRAVRRASRGDDGFTIVEALVAILVFSLIAIGVAQTTVSAVRLSGDGQHRTVALNVASTELDRLKALNNPYNIASTSSAITSTIDGVTYSLTRSVSWVNVAGNEISCSAASGTFQLLRVRVRVDWGGRMSGSNPVSTATTISPQNTILSPTTATLFISVFKSDGTPYPGITPNVVGPGGASLTAPATNADGCSYLTGIGAGNYTVTVTGTGGISTKQTAVAAANPATTIVTAGSAQSVPFSYDQKATLVLGYGPATALAPSDLKTTYTNATDPTPYVVSGTPATVGLFPVSSGYSVVAGTLVEATTGATPYAGCYSPDPAKWTAGSVSGTALRAGVDPANATTSPAASAAYTIPMGTINVSTTTGGTVRILSATATASGDPGCAPVSGSPAQTYNYTIPVAGTWSLAVPYGAWTSSFARFSSPSSFSSINATTTSNAYTSSPSPSFTVDPRTT